MQISDEFQRQVSAIRAKRFADPIAREVFENFEAQIGEVGWHSVHVDETLDVVSDRHAAEMLRRINENNLVKPKVLELGAYAHHSAHIVAAETGGIAVSHDISKASLLEGIRRAKARGFECQHVAVAGDFHDLPFEDDWFDFVFVASSIHHTWRPWKVMAEMLRVLRPGGILHINNEPIGRTGSLYAFRGNRIGERTPFENGIEAFGLTATISSPFPGSRPEALFGIIENDRIPFHVYRDALASGDCEIREWTVDFSDTVGPFEKWLVEALPRATEIHERLTENLRRIEHDFSKRDSMCGFSIPSDDQLWPLCYHLEHSVKKLDAAASKEELMVDLFGGALTATLEKNSPDFNAPKSPSLFEHKMFKRELASDFGVYRDLPASSNVSIELENALSGQNQKSVRFVKTDWDTLVEQNGIESLCNLGGCAVIDSIATHGILILRTYSVADDQPYFFDVLVNNDLIYSHCVTASESHLAKCIVKSGDEILIRLHRGDLVPLNLPYHSRIIARFIAIKTDMTSEIQ